jgi:hypothetical protein
MVPFNATEAGTEEGDGDGCCRAWAHREAHRLVAGLHTLLGGRVRVQGARSTGQKNASLRPATRPRCTPGVCTLNIGCRVQGRRTTSASQTLHHQCMGSDMQKGAGATSSSPTPAVSREEPGAPKPPPPGVMMRTRSQGPTGTVALPDSPQVHTHQLRHSLNANVSELRLGFSNTTRNPEGTLSHNNRKRGQSPPG